MSIYKIYKIINLINNKLYVGFTSKELKERFKIHEYSSRSGDYWISQAIRKHGIENFKIELLYENYDERYTLKIMEPYFIKEYNTFLGEGYNMTSGGDGILNYKHSDETKRKMSEAHSGRKFTEEHKEKLKEAWKIRRLTPMSDDTRLKISKSMDGIKKSKKTKEKMSEYAKNRSESHRKNLSIAQTGIRHRSLRVKLDK